MKQTVVLNCYKIAVSANLQPLAAFFRLPDYHHASNYLLLLPKQLETILKHHVTDQYVWLFKSGCICLVNFNTVETYRLLNHFTTIGLEPDLELFVSFNELHTLEFEAPTDPLATVRLLQLYAIVLSKSTELKRLEALIDTTVDRSERFIIELQKGFSDPTKAGFFQTNLTIIKFQLTMIHTLKILDRPAECYHESVLKKCYATVARDYELARRYHTLQKKITSLNEVLTPYQKLGFKHTEQRLLLIEIVLLVLFPLFRILNYLIYLIPK
jgi:uncharacterized Rmd1/YagE family protein